MEAMEAAMWAGSRTSRTTTVDVACAARALGADDDDAPPSRLLSGYAARLLDGYPAAVGRWRGATAAFGEQLEAAPNLQWHGMMWNATGEMLDFRAHRAVARRWVALARQHGGLSTLPIALSGLGWCEVLAGRLEAAESLLAEALEIATATGGPAVPGGNEILHMGILDWRGDDAARPLAAGIVAEAAARGQGLGETIAQYGTTILELGHGRYQSAHGAAMSVFEQDALYFGTINLADVIEAAIRCDDRESADAALARLTTRARATATPWGLGLLARGRALLATDAEAEALYQTSLEQLRGSGLATEVARTHLLYGEWLRRQRRRRDARVELHSAHDLFQKIGAEAFAGRARDELQATGEHARTRAPETSDLLTPRERQIAWLAARGETNAAIGAQLFISQHTVAYHLRSIFGKLDITSRGQLAAVVAERLRASEPGA
jgi:DNA-binding CsgD family transcriptional regulator